MENVKIVRDYLQAKATAAMAETSFTSMEDYSTWMHISSYWAVTSETSQKAFGTMDLEKLKVDVEKMNPVRAWTSIAAVLDKFIETGVSPVRHMKRSATRALAYLDQINALSTTPSLPGWEDCPRVLFFHFTFPKAEVEDKQYVDFTIHVANQTGPITTIKESCLYVYLGEATSDE